MKDINLIPPDVLETRRVRHRLRAWVVTNLGVAGVLGLCTVVAAWSLGVEKRSAGKIDTRLTEIQGYSLELQQLRAERSTLAGEEQALGALMDRAPDHYLVHTVARAIADQGWLTRMELTRPVGEPREDQKEGGRLVLEGHAGSYHHLARLMSQLDHLDCLAGVNLRRSQRGQVDGMDVIGFELECSLVPGT